MNARQHSLAAVLVAVLAAAAVAGVAAPADAADGTPTYVDGNVTADTTWTAEEGPYFVGSDVTVERGATLTIEPGTTVNLGEEVRLTVRGSLVANGTAAEPVQFTTAEPSPSAGTWETIEYAGGSASTLRLDHAVVEYGQTAITATSSAGTVSLTDATVRNHVATGLAATNRDGVPRIRVSDSRFAALGNAGIQVAVPETNPYVESVSGLRVTGTTFRETGSYGVLVRAREISSVTVADTVVSGVDSAGFRFATEPLDARPQASADHYAEDVTVRNVAVRGAGEAGVSFQGGDLARVTVRGATVSAVGGPGISVRDVTDADDLRVSGNTVTDASTGIRVAVQQPVGSIPQVSMALSDNEVRRSSEFGVDVDLSTAVVESLRVSGNTLVENGDGGVHVGGQRLANAVVAANVVRANDGPGIDAAAVRIRGLSVTRNRVTGNAGDGITVHASEDLSGLVVADNDVLDNDGFGVDTVHHAAGSQRNLFSENTILANGDGLRLVGPAATRVANNTVALNTAGRERLDDGAATGGTGVVVANASSNVVLRHNDVYGHITGLRSSAEGVVDAEHNYWGAASGPYHATLNPDGEGDTVVTDLGKADPVPYASEPFGPRFRRPTAVLEANETTIEAGDAVRFSASASHDDGRLTAYYFSVAGDRVPGSGSETYVRRFDEPGTYEVSLTVEDDVGVRSLNDASVTIRVENATSTTQPTTQTTTQQPTATATPTTTPNGSDQGDGDDSLLGSLFSLWGGLGAAFYLLALGLGTYGTWLSLQGEEPPVSGRTIHALAGVGVLTWAAAGFLVDGNLLTFAGGGAVAWGALTGAVLALAG